MKAPIRTLVAGVGTRGKHWVRLVHEESLTEPVAYVDIDSASLEWLQDHYDAPPDHCFGDLGEAVDATKPDLVILATPPTGHLTEARLVRDAGAHLLAEKPLTLDFAESLEIVRLFEESDFTLTVGLNFRYLPTTIKAMELIRYQVGRPSFSRFIYWRNRDGKRPGINKYPLTMRQPMLYEQSIHHLDLFRYVYQAEAQRVWCRCHNPPWSMYADDATVAALIEMDNGMLVDYFGTWAGQTLRHEFAWRTDCERGALVQRDQFSDLHLIRPDSDVEELVPTPEIENFVDDTRAMLNHIALQLLDGVERPHPSGLDHLRTMALTVACDESNVSGEPVMMSDFYDRHGVPEAWR